MKEQRKSIEGGSSKLKIVTSSRNAGVWALGKSCQRYPSLDYPFNEVRNFSIEYPQKGERGEYSGC